MYNKRLHPIPKVNETANGPAERLLLAHFAAPLLTKQHILLWRTEKGE